MNCWDVLVVGAGNAGLSAALAAKEAGASVLVLERAPLAARGGNSRFTGGGFRVAYRSSDELSRIIPDLTQKELAERFATPYPPEEFMDELGELTSYRADPDLVERIAVDGLDAVAWLREKGVRFLPMHGWHGLTIQSAGGGQGLMDSLFAAVDKAGIDVWYDARATDLLFDGRSVNGVSVLHDGERVEVEAKSVILAAGGFQANAEWRTRYLGAGWDIVPVRGTWCNTGDGIAMALAVGAQPHGQWSGAHAVAWDFHAPAFGDVRVGDGFQKHSYPMGIVVNARGERFVDEGANFLDYTYARYGKEMLAQPGQIAWQVFDAKQTSHLRDEYRIRGVSRLAAATLPDLARKMEGIDAEAFLHTIEEFNASIDTSVPLDLTILDGRRANTAVPKSNWADPVTEGPFEAYPVTCGITFTFGGVRVDTSARAIGYDGRPVDALYAIGEMAAGVFYFNYPGGSGLTKGVVEGRTAGREAAELAATRIATARPTRAAG